MEDELEEYYWPKEPEYPSVIPEELTACFDKSQAMLKKIEQLKVFLDRASVVLQSAQPGHEDRPATLPESE